MILLSTLAFASSPVFTFGPDHVVVTVTRQDLESISINARPFGDLSCKVGERWIGGTRMAFERHDETSASVTLSLGTQVTASNMAACDFTYGSLDEDAVAQTREWCWRDGDVASESCGESRENWYLPCDVDAALERLAPVNASDPLRSTTIAWALREECHVQSIEAWALGAPDSRGHLLGGSILAFPATWTEACANHEALAASWQTYNGEARKQVIAEQCAPERFGVTADIVEIGRASCRERV